MLVRRSKVLDLALIVPQYTKSEGSSDMHYWVLYISNPRSFICMIVTIVVLFLLDPRLQPPSPKRILSLKKELLTKTLSSLLTRPARLSNRLEHVSPYITVFDRDAGGIGLCGYSNWSDT
jgi:hypothetical protein